MKHGHVIALNKCLRLSLLPVIRYPVQCSVRVQNMTVTAKERNTENDLRDIILPNCEQKLDTNLTRCKKQNKTKTSLEIGVPCKAGIHTHLLKKPHRALKLNIPNT